MGVQGLTTQTLLELHHCIAACQRVDDEAIARGQHYVYGTRRYKSWSEQADAFEAELHRRKVEFQPIGW